MKKIVILLAVAVLSLGAANAQVKKTNAASTASTETETPAKACDKQDNKKQANTNCAATKSTCKNATHNCNGCKGHKSNCPQKESAPAKVSKTDNNGNTAKK